jgi:hypothetical protein
MPLQLKTHLLNNEHDQPSTVYDVQSFDLNNDHRHTRKHDAHNEKFSQKGLGVQIFSRFICHTLITYEE